MIVTRRMTGQTVDAGVYTAAVKMFARRLVEQTKCLGQSPLALDTGMTCVLGLIAVFTATYTRTMGESKILNCIRSYSRYVADWVIRAGEIIILEGDPDHNMVLRLDGMYTIIRGGFSLVAELEEEGLKDDRIFDLLIRLWLRAGLKKDKKLIEVVSVALSIVDGPLLLSQGDNVLDIASRHNDSIMSVMQTAIDHFKRDMRWFQTLATTFSLPTVSVNFSTMHGHLLFLAILVSGVSWDGPRNRSGEIFNRFFVEVEGLKVVLRAVAVIIKHVRRSGPEDTSRTEVLMEVVSRAFCLVKNSLQWGQTAAPMMQAMAAGLLKTIIKVSPVFKMLEEEAQAAVMRLLIDMLVSWTDIHSVAKQMKRLSPIKKAVESGRLVKVMRESGLKPFWSHFIDTLRARDAFYRRTQSLQNHQVVRCHNVSTFGSAFHVHAPIIAFPARL